MTWTTAEDPSREIYPRKNLWQKVVMTANSKAEITMSEDILREKEDHQSDICAIKEGVV